MGKRKGEREGKRKGGRKRNGEKRKEEYTAETEIIVNGGRTVGRGEEERDNKDAATLPTH